MTAAEHIVSWANRQLDAAMADKHLDADFARAVLSACLVATGPNSTASAHFVASRVLKIIDGERDLAHAQAAQDKERLHPSENLDRGNLITQRWNEARKHLHRLRDELHRDVAEYLRSQR